MPMLSNPATKYPGCAPVALRDRAWPDAMLSRAPQWCSVDLRDGNQALIEPMTPARKRRMFDTLVRIGFKEIEVGFPSASAADFDFVRQLIEERLIPDDVTIQVLTPARAPLIEKTFESVRGAPRAIVHLYNATAPVMRQVVLGLDQDGIVELATTHARLVQSLAQQQTGTHWTFQYSPEMFSGTELAFAKRVIDAVTGVWQPTAQRRCIINLPSTVELSTPNVFADSIEWMHRHLDRREGIVLSVHPHNDRGTGTAAGELALMAGCERIEGCLFGNGERTGNVDLVNIALNLYTQGVSPGLDFSDIDEVRRCVEHCTQLPVHPRHPYVGDLVYTSFSGSHQDAIKKAFAARRSADVWNMPYLPIDPQDLGRTYDAVIRVNSQSGKGGMAYLLETTYGLELPRRLQIELSAVAQAVLDLEGRELTATDLWALFDSTFELSAPVSVQAVACQEQADGSVKLQAQVVLGAETWNLAGRGNGPVVAAAQALSLRIGRRLKVLDYHEHTTGSGNESRAVAYVELCVDDQPGRYGVGMDTDIVGAAVKALLSAVRRAGVVLESATVQA